MSDESKFETQDENALKDVDDFTPESEKTNHASTLDSTETAAKDDELSVKLEAAEKESREHYDRLLRVSAEFDNYKKRTSREMQDLAKYATEKVLKELLVVVDNLERAVASCEPDPEQADPLLQGVHLTLSEVLKLLERYHVTPIVALGESFDPTFHQAMMQEEVQGQPANMVVSEMQKGYLLHDRLLRPALVAVSKAIQNQDDDSQNNE